MAVNQGGIASSSRPCIWGREFFVFYSESRRTRRYKVLSRRYTVETRRYIDTSRRYIPQTRRYPHIKQKGVSKYAGFKSITS